MGMVKEIVTSIFIDYFKVDVELSLFRSLWETSVSGEVIDTWLLRNWDVGF